MAAGNTGEYLDTAADSTCTWLSRDGGFSWEDVANYAAIYEFGDHGSILLTARYQVSNSAATEAPPSPVAAAAAVVWFGSCMLQYACQWELTSADALL